MMNGGLSGDGWATAIAGPAELAELEVLDLASSLFHAITMKQMTLLIGFMVM